MVGMRRRRRWVLHAAASLSAAVCLAAVGAWWYSSDEPVTVVRQTGRFEGGAFLWRKQALFLRDGRVQVARLGFALDARNRSHSHRPCHQRPDQRARHDPIDG